MFSLTALLVGEKLPPDAEIDVSSISIAFNLLEWSVAFLKSYWAHNSSQNDPFKLKTGGVVDMKRVKDRNRDM